MHVNIYLSAVKSEVSQLPPLELSTVQHHAIPFSELGTSLPEAVPRPAGIVVCWFVGLFPEAVPRPAGIVVIWFVCL